MWLQVYIIIVSWYSVFEDKLFENSENKIKDEYIRIEKQYSETGGGKMKSIGKPICTILLTVALIFTFAPWTGAMNEAYAATDTIQSVNISCDIPAIGLKEGRTEKQVYQIIDNYSKCTTTGVVVRSSYDLTFWDEPWDRFTSTTSRDNFVDPALQYYLSQSLFAADDYAWPNNVKQATSWTKVSSLAGFKITLNNVNCDAAVIRYVEVGRNRWLDVNIPIGNEISKSTVVVYPNAADYSGGPLEPAWFRVDLPDGMVLDEARYTMTYLDASGKKVDKPVVPGVYRLKITANGIYCGTAWGTYTILPMCILDGGNAKLTKTEYTYDGKEKTPGAVVTRNGRTLVAGADYTISYKNNKNAGTAAAIITGTGLYGDGWELNFVIKKAANPMKTGPKTVTIKYSKLKKKAAYIKRSKAMTVKGAKGPVTYKLVSVKKAGKKAKFTKYFRVDKKKGKIRIARKLKKGTYTLKINVKADGNSNFKAKKKPVYVKVIVK